MHSERGEETIERILHMMAGHDLNHLQQIERILTQNQEVVATGRIQSLSATVRARCDRTAANSLHLFGPWSPGFVFPGNDETPDAGFILFCRP